MRNADKILKSVYLKQSTIDLLETVASQERRSFSSQAAFILERWVAENATTQASGRRSVRLRRSVAEAHTD